MRDCKNRFTKFIENRRKTKMLGLFAQFEGKMLKQKLLGLSCINCKNLIKNKEIRVQCAKMVLESNRVVDYFPCYSLPIAFETHIS